MPNVKLDQGLLEKVALRVGLPSNLQAIRNRVLRRARSLGISSEAALVLLAKDLGIGYHSALRRLSDDQRAEVRGAAPVSPTKSKFSQRQLPATRPLTEREEVGRITQRLLKDDLFRDRVQDLILAPRNYDRPISEATKVLEIRIRRIAKPPKGLFGENLVDFAFNEDLTKTRFKISDDSDEQRGYTRILKGMVAALRNPTHHDIIDTFSQEDAIRICAFIDVLLRIVNNSQKVK